MTDPRTTLEAAQTILLVDWPSTTVPRALLEAGFTVLGYCPDRFSAAELVAERPDNVEPASIFPPQGEGERGYLVFRVREDRTSHVDLVNTYRPAAELPGIVAKLVLPLGARALWLQPPGTSAEARRLADERGLAFVEGVDIAEVARAISAAKE
jgi:predicted CoA-binding protein